MIKRADIWRVSHKVTSRRAHGVGEVSGAVETIVLKLTDEDGISGWGEAAPWAPFAGTAEASMAALARYLAPAYLGRPAATLPAIMAGADRLLAGHWDAKAALESALLDLEARRRGVPVWALLGGKGRARIPLSISIADPVWTNDEALIERTWAAGIRRYKLKTGFADHGFDLMRIEAIRARYGEAALISVDYNQGLSPVAAMAQVRDMDAMGLTFIEPFRSSSAQTLGATETEIAYP